MKKEWKKEKNLAVERKREQFKKKKKIRKKMF